ncbi:MAG: hypothetical protein BM485_15955 [Desulfobulbaceae bacterium DB1]|nr:MAG: hypothetical protein BM485_15955 [Desulfobulbaceae bacterium DB1]
MTQEGRGAQSRLAGQQNIDRGYLNAIVKGRKPGSEEVRAKIAGHFNMTYESMLALGRGLLGKAKGETSLKMKGGEEISAPPLDDAIWDKSVVGFKSPRKSRDSRSGISEKILKVVEILESNTRFRDMLTELIDAFHESVSMKNENLKLQNQMKEMEARIASLEKALAFEKDRIQKSA